jgi:hypothetical protein
MGFERAADARQMTADLAERLAKFGCYYTRTKPG